MESQLEILDAFIDGERVDAALFKSALAQEDGRDYFVDAWLLRDATQADSMRETPAAVIPLVQARAKPRPWMIAAAVASALFAGYFAGYQTPRGTVLGQTPDTSVAVTVPPAPTHAPAAFPVPPATRVIQLEFRPTPGEGGGG